MLRSINLNFSNLCNDEIVRILKDSKANITPTRLRELIQLGQNVNQTCTKGLTPLHYCCLYKKPDLIYVLVENFADIYIKDKNNRSPLYYAVETNNSKIIKLLLCKANKKEKDLANLQILIYSIELGKKKLISESIKKGAMINKNLRDKIAQFHFSKYKTSIIQLLIDFGTNFNFKDEDGRNAIFYAQKEIINLLFKNDLNKKTKDNNGMTALQYACSKNQIEKIDLLIKYGASLTDKDIYGMNALHIASYYSNLESVKLLLNYYENLNYKTDRGMTALHLAVWKNDMNIMKLLLYNGADIKIQNNEGRTVLHIASINNNEGILNYLLNNYNCNYYCKDNYGKQFFNYLNDDFY